MRTALFSLFLLASTPVFACSELLDVSMRPLAKEQPEKLCDRFDGQVLLLVNTASKCGFTPQYEGLEALHAKYGKQGFAVVGFPSNEFMGQEPGTEKEILEFCTLTYGVKFPMYEKTQVRGDDANPLYRRLKAATGEEPGWNFHKYLVDRSGKVVGSFGARTKPDNEDLIAQIEALLAVKAPTAKVAE